MLTLVHVQRSLATLSPQESGYQTSVTKEVLARPLLVTDLLITFKKLVSALHTALF